jgi:3-oxoacyl-[acyl-carrier protein] reductase
MQFQDKRVVITGAAGVFGTWIAEFFARKGAKLCLSDNRQDALEKLAARLKLDAAGHILHNTELTDEASILDLAVRVRERWGAPDIVINNAGLYTKFALLGMSGADWDNMLASTCGRRSS